MKDRTYLAITQAIPAKMLKKNRTRKEGKTPKKWKKEIKKTSVKMKEIAA